MARRALAVVLVGWGTSAAVVEVVQLLVSELVTNAVVHAASPPCLQMTAGPPRLRVSVRDSDSAAPVLGRADRDDEGGRGLCLVQALATRWGSRPCPGGKWVWFEIDSDGTA
jgi:anti-sigma regulatory factor (Ser/Thr protein kinase)